MEEYLKKSAFFCLKIADLAGFLVKKNREKNAKNRAALRCPRTLRQTNIIFPRVFASAKSPFSSEKFEFGKNPGFFTKITVFAKNRVFSLK